MKKRLVQLVKIAVVLVLVTLGVGWFRFWQIAHWNRERQAARAKLTITHVAGTVYLIDASLNGRQVGASVAASVGDDGVLLVDSTTATVLARRLATALEELHDGAAPVVWVINTHAHPDHVLGNAVFGAQATVLAHHATGERLAQPFKPFPWLPKAPPIAAVGRPDETFSENRTLRFNGEEVHLLHLGAAHTDGDVVVYFAGSNVAHVGDLFNGRGGRSVAAASYGGQWDGLRRALGALLVRLPEDVRIVGGHGGVGQVATYADLAEYDRLVDEMIERTRQRIAAGTSLERVQAERPSDRFIDWFAHRRDDSVMHGPPAGWQASLYRTLSAEAADKTEP